MASLGSIKGLSSWTQLCWDTCSRCKSLKFRLMLKLRQSFLTATFQGLKDSILRAWRETSSVGLLKIKDKLLAVTCKCEPALAEPQVLRDVTLTLL